MGWVKVNGSEKDVVKALDDGAETVNQVCDAVDYHEDTVRTTLDKLENKDVLESELRSMDRGGHKKYYELTDDARVRHEADRYVKEMIPFPVLFFASMSYFMYNKIPLFQGLVGVSIVIVPLLVLRLKDIIGRGEGVKVEIREEEKEHEEEHEDEVMEAVGEEVETDLELPESWTTG